MHISLLAVSRHAGWLHVARVAMLFTSYDFCAPRASLCLMSIQHCTSICSTQSLAAALLL
jgi:hypothetical protein